jgi:queuine/archaeosine tRNA-ribosyltransferase
MFSNKEELDRLISNMDEKAIQNLLSMLDLYIYERSLEEIKDRINSEDFNEKFERKMR